VESIVGIFSPYLTCSAIASSESSLASQLSLVRYYVREGVAGFDSDAAARYVLCSPQSRATVVGCSNSSRKACASLRASRNRDGLADAHEAQIGRCPEPGSRSIS
jgi:hypothetical protein